MDRKVPLMSDSRDSRGAPVAVVANSQSPAPGTPGHEQTASDSTGASGRATIHLGGGERPSSSTLLVQPFGASAPLVDIAITVAALAGTLVLLSKGGLGAVHAGSKLDALGAVLGAATTAPLLVWRRSPFAVFAVLAAAATAAAALGYALGVPVGPAAALYLLAASRGESRPWAVRSAAVVVGLFFSFLAAAATEPGLPGVDLLHIALPWAVGWFAGERSRLRRERMVAMGERLARAAHEAEQGRLLAVAEERARIARDLHDSAGSAINVIAVRAGAARLGYDRDPDRSRLVLGAIEDLARQTVAEIDHMVASLRDPSPTPGTVEAPPGLASLDTLIGQHRSAGTTITLATEGPQRPLSGPVDRAAYRIAQEALTNAARHGTGATRIELVFAEAELQLSVTNRIGANPRRRPGGGHGLIGMREQATLLAGILHVENDAAEFRVRAQLPYRSQDR